MPDKEIYSSRLRAGNKTWCVEMKEDANGSAFLEMTEHSKIAGSERPRRIVVDKAHAEDLLETMADAVRRLLAHEHRKKRPAPEQTKTYTVEAVRKEHPQAYARWTAEQDELLERLYCEGTPRKELASIFGREPSAITSRIKKLELREKYGK